MAPRRRPLARRAEVAKMSPCVVAPERAAGPSTGLVLKVEEADTKTIPSSCLEAKKRQMEGCRMQ